jgi:mRNA-degrading endonuclease RelE of RelBE toxin-antitoxin system
MMKEIPYQLSSQNKKEWKVVAHSQKIYKNWNSLMEKIPESLERCLEYLCETPMQRYPKRVFPLRGKKYKGAWEFEVTGGDRVLYVPDPETKIVTVYYAGKHPKPPSPLPPKN